MSLAHQIVQPSKAAAQMQFHPLADLFPLMTEEELESLTADIKEHGQREPIVLFEGKILDGRNRYRACETLGFQVKSKDWDGQGSAQAFVVSHNLHRRHLNESQRAMIAVKIANAKQGQRTDLKSKPSANLQKVVVTAAEAAKMLNISDRTVMAARTVLEKATPEEIAAVEAGEASVNTLERQIREKVPAKERLAKGADPHKARADSYRANSQLWGVLRDALDNLTSLPRPIDVVAVARAHDRNKFTDTKLLPALQWITEFSDAWTNPDAEANSGRKDRSSRKAKEASAAERTEGSAPETAGPVREARPGRGAGNGGWREDHVDA